MTVSLGILDNGWTTWLGPGPTEHDAHDDRGSGSR